MTTTKDDDAQGRDEQRVAEIRAKHAPFDFGMRHPISGKWSSRVSCKGCHRPWPCEPAELLARLGALEAERDAVRENHEAALDKVRADVTYWMGQRDKFFDQLEGERKAHARTQEWLDKFQSEAATQQVRAIKAERARDDALARLAAAEAALQNIVAVLGPAACACDGQQVEVDTALGYARAALAGSREQQGEGDGRDGE